MRYEDARPQKLGCVVLLAMKTDGNGWKNPISTSVSIFFGENGIGFGKYGFENGIGICGHTETNKYGWRAGKLNQDHII
jgi:hypothetical protein